MTPVLIQVLYRGYVQGHIWHHRNHMDDYTQHFEDIHGQYRFAISQTRSTHETLMHEMRWDRKYIQLRRTT